MDDLARLRAELVADPSNAWAAAAGLEPLYAAAAPARIAVVGQAPGRRAQELGVPWKDASGDTLRRWLGVTEEQFYDPSTLALLPMDFFYPGRGRSGDLPPRPDFARTWHPRILAHLPNLALMVLVGQYSQRYYLRGVAKGSLTQTVRAYREYLPQFFPLVHPSPLNFRWQAKNPWFEAEVVPELASRVRAVLAD